MAPSATGETSETTSPAMLLTETETELTFALRKALDFNRIPQVAI